MRILLVDDHPIVRHGIRSLLSERIAGSTIIDAADGDTALTLLAQAPWDIVLLDLTLRGRSGLDVLKELRHRQLGVPVLVLSIHPVNQFALRALNAGAQGYVSKDSSPDELVDAIDTVRRGRRYVTPEARELVVGWAQQEEKAPHERLSDREYQVLRMIGSGQTVSDIAKAFRISVKTVSTYRSRVLEKLGMQSNAELMRYAIENHLLDS